jgi:hypothetical protein
LLIVATLLGIGVAVVTYGLASGRPPHSVSTHEDFDPGF